MDKNIVVWFNDNDWSVLAKQIAYSTHYNASEITFLIDKLRKIRSINEFWGTLFEEIREDGYETGYDDGYEIGSSL